ncbi:MAG: hypothetical protein ACOZIN_20625 [Myxococcota bacterium]
MKNQLRVIAFLVMLLGGLGLWSLLRAQPAPPSTPVPAVTRVDIDRPVTYWVDQGFMEMVPPIRLPSTRTEKDRITVWLRVPAGKVIEVEEREWGPTLRYPPGTAADRVEWRAYSLPDGIQGWTVLDVRGTRLDAQGREHFHVYLPNGPLPQAPLFGYEWPRGDASAERAATDLFVTFLQNAPSVSAEGHLMDEAQRDKRVALFTKRNDCGGCHRYHKPEARKRSPQEPLHRPTDALGWYGIYSVLRDAVPLEYHRPRDMNVADPFVTVSCPEGAPKLLEDPKGGRYFVCDQGYVPKGRLDLEAALAAKDARAEGLCRSRRYLYEHMDEKGRGVFAEAFRACGL